MSEEEKKIDPDYDNLEVNEPYLGPWWAVLMLALYLIKRMFPAAPYTTWWWIYVYMITLLIVVTVFTIYKRFKYNRWLKERDKVGAEK